MSSDATHSDIELEVRKMDLNWVSSFMTKTTLEGLRRRAYSPVHFQKLADQSKFGTCEIQTEGISLEVRLKKDGIGR